MKTNRLGMIALGAGLLAASPALAYGQHSFSLKNDTGATIDCGIKRDGSSAMEGITIKTGEVWTKSYSSSKARRVRCEGLFSSWQLVQPDAAYRLVKDSDERILVQSQ
ncbi:MAG: hypothetical protein QOH04_486 [Sphingomonadales bacterium]|jgi:hypothetical protein|nr:hypothetical protein [Sphingomonadales bacterium]MEA3034727.1 hypothetical protein [Sphingomonadales bacterium]